MVGSLGKIIGICLITAVMMFIFKNYQDPDPNIAFISLVRWIFHMLLGLFIHVALLLIFMARNLLPEKKSLKGLFPLFFLGAFCTFLLFLGIKDLNFYNPLAVFFLIGLIFSISAVVQLFLYMTNVYDLAIQKQKVWRRQKLEKGASHEQPEYILVPLNKEETRQIHVSELSTVYVEDHYLYFVYRRDNEFQTLNAYGKLISYEEKLLPGFLKINRSTLINTEFIQQIIQKRDKSIIVMQGLPEKEFPIPKSRQDLMELLPSDH